MNFPGTVLLTHGFRVFFLAAGIWAPVGLVLWIAMLTGAIDPPTALPGAAWHGHELIFGYAAAVIAGFLLTAVPNWTGRLPVRGRGLMLLAALWAAARLANLLAGAAPWIATVLDVGFLAALAGTTAREVVIAGNQRNYPVVGLVAALALACLLSHLENVDPDIGALGRRAAIGIVLGLIAVIGGRVVPSFTRNWLAKRGGPLPAPVGRLDTVALVLLAAGLVAWVAQPTTVLTGWLLVIAGMAQGVRLSRWRGDATGAEPLVLILHLGYGWLALGLVLLGGGLLLPESVGRLTTLHALTAGAIGTMTLAIMTRATLGHTARALTADRATVAIYTLVQVGALLRVTAPVLPMPYVTALSIAAVAWGGAFVLFVLHCGPMLLTARADRAAGPA